MNRTLLALALMGVTSGAAYAQSSVTLYGELDAGLLYTNKTLAPTTGGNAGSNFSLIDGGRAPSFFGFTGTEDLGGGLKAKFKIESGINVANGGLNNSNGNQFGRQAWLALDGNFGEFKAGLQFSPFFLAVDESDPRAFSLFGSGALPYVNSAIGTGIFNSNAVSYTTPRFAGLQGRAMLALGGSPGDFQAGRQYSFAVNYEHGGLTANAAFYDGNAGGTANTPVPTNLGFEGRMLGVSYAYGPVIAKASFVNYKVAGSANNNVYGGGLTYYVSPAFDVNGGVWVTSDRDHTTNHSVLAALGAEYFLSKTTSLYAQVGLVDNHGAMDTGLSITGALNEVPGTTTGADIGIRHTF
ncbi:Outer membrane porin protein 32 [Paraburkholderia caffeinitolerans]|uniref:Outer membrane porin protein 32 n=1 Tax=Paraburkholderia caffeinitolerans TaxID=1723730 RepID=A0A6J5G2S4_9BURK|nr:porin [Paraburkholderia caffeinitolerans]CAB3790929.1 Outer membrane porin protein 32 [Paraburkholderia caffeinitolerans]